MTAKAEIDKGYLEVVLDATNLSMTNPSFCDSLVEIHMKSSTLSLSDCVTFMTIYCIFGP